MTPRMDRFWLHRTQRERVMLLAGAAVLLLLALYGLVLTPLAEATQSMAKRAMSLEREVARMEKHAAQMPALRQAAASRKVPAMAPAEIVAHARRFELDLTLGHHTSSSREPRIALSGSALLPSNLLAWLDALQREQGWRVAEMRMAQVAGGRVNADLILTQQ